MGSFRLAIYDVFTYTQMKVKLNGSSGVANPQWGDKPPMGSFISHFLTLYYSLFFVTNERFNDNTNEGLMTKLPFDGLVLAAVSTKYSILNF